MITKTMDLDAPVIVDVVIGNDDEKYFRGRAAKIQQKHEAVAHYQSKIDEYSRKTIATAIEAGELLIEDREKIRSTPILWGDFLKWCGLKNSTWENYRDLAKYQERLRNERSDFANLTIREALRLISGWKRGNRKLRDDFYLPPFTVVTAWQPSVLDQEEEWLRSIPPSLFELEQQKRLNDEVEPILSEIERLSSPARIYICHCIWSAATAQAKPEPASELEFAEAAE